MKTKVHFKTCALQKGGAVSICLVLFLAATGKSQMLDDCNYGKQEVDCTFAESECSSTACGWGDINDYCCAEIDAGGYLQTTMVCPDNTKIQVSSGLIVPDDECSDQAYPEFLTSISDANSFECWREQFCLTTCTETTQIIVTSSMDCENGPCNETASKAFKVRAAYCDGPSGVKLTIADGSGVRNYDKCSDPDCQQP